jgi:hypothetical protein
MTRMNQVGDVASSRVPGKPDSVDAGHYRIAIRRAGDQLTCDGDPLALAAATDLGKALFALSGEFDGGFGEPRRAVKGPAPAVAAGYLRAAAARLAGRPAADRLTRLANQLCMASSQAGQDAPGRAASAGGA